MLRRSRPSWARHLGELAWPRFLALVQAYLAQRGFVGRLGPDGLFHSDDAGQLRPQPGGSIDLETLGYICALAKEDSWPRHVARVLGARLQLLRREQHAAALATPTPDLLRVRLWPTAHAGPSRPLAHRLSYGLVLQLRGVVVPLSAEELNSWGMTEDEAFAIGRANLASTRLEPVVRALRRGGASGQVVQLTGSSPLAASQALRLDSYIGDHNDWGALVIIPDTSQLLFHPIGDHASLHAAIEQLSRFAHSAFRRAPQPMSRELFWWYRGAFHHLPIEPQDDNLLFTPPDLFVDTVLDHFG